MQMNLRAARSLQGGGESGATKQQVLLNGISEERIWKRISTYHRSVGPLQVEKRWHHYRCDLHSDVL